MSRYAKTLASLIPLLLAGLKVLSDAVGDGTVSQTELIAMAVAVLNSALVFSVPNTAPAGEAPRRDLSERG